jgi:hypothetical protein
MAAGSKGDLRKTMKMKGNMKAEQDPEGDDLSAEALKKVQDSIKEEFIDLTKRPARKDM